MIQMFSNTLGKEELEAVKKVFDSKWLGFCNETKMFEKEFAQKIDHPYVLSTNSCTTALNIAMRTLDIGPGDEVIIPTVNFVGCANAIISRGAKPVFIDVDTRYFNVLPSEIEKHRSSKTKAVLVLHYGGHPCNMDEIYQVADGLYIIEDSANSLFSTYKGKHCGTLGHAACFSFDSMKVLVTGDGGMITLKNEELYEKAFEYRYFGFPKESTSGMTSLEGGKIERWWEFSLNRISDRNVTNDILSSIGRVQLKKLPSFIEKRKEIWQIYQDEFKNLSFLETPPEPLPDTESSCYIYWLKIKDNKRDKFARYLVDNEIYCTFRYYPLHLVEYYQAKASLPNAELISEEAINIPLHQNLTEGDISKIVEVVKKFY